MLTNNNIKTRAVYENEKKIQLNSSDMTERQKKKHGPITFQMISFYYTNRKMYFLLSCLRQWSAI